LSLGALLLVRQGLVLSSMSHSLHGENRR
jgi:hypothetical protein